MSISTAPTICRASTRPRLRSSASAANFRSRPCSTCTPSRTISAWRSRATVARARPCSGARPRKRRAASTVSSRSSGCRRGVIVFPGRPRAARRDGSRTGLSPAVRHRIAGSLAHGQKQWLEIGMLLAQEPKLLLVDEPVAGMTDAETRQTAELLKEINRDRTVVVVEHDMTFVRELGVKVTCLHEGSVLAEGTIDQVSENERVVEVYLGRWCDAGSERHRSALRRGAG